MQAQQAKPQIKLHQPMLANESDWSRNVTSGTLDSITDGPGYVEITCTGLTTIDFQRPLRDSFGKERRDGYFWHQLFYCKTFTADVPGAAGVFAVTGGIWEDGLTTSERGGPRYDLATTVWTPVIVGRSGSGVGPSLGAGRSWCEAWTLSVLGPDDTALLRVRSTARSSSGSTTAIETPNNSGIAYTAPVQGLRIVIPNTGTCRIYIGLAVYQTRVMDSPFTTYRPLRAADLTLLTGTGTIEDDGSGGLVVTGAAGPTWTFPLEHVGTVGSEEVVLFGATMDKPSAGRVIVGLYDSVTTMKAIGVQFDGQVYANGVSGGAPVGVTRAAWAQCIGGWSSLGNTYGHAYDSAGARQDSRAASDLTMTGGTLLGTLNVTSNGTFVVGYWVSEPIPLAIVQRGQ